MAAPKVSATGRIETQDDHVESESTPLLQTQSISATTSTKKAAAKPWKLVLGLCVVLVFLTDLGALMAAVPILRLMEDITCVKYWISHDPSKLLPNGSVLEENCKGKEVQEIVALVAGWQVLWDAVPGIILAVPLGALADRIGRKPVLWASIVGILMSVVWICFICGNRLDLRLTWLSSAFTLIGGGPVVAVAMLLTMVGDTVPEDQMTTAFLWLEAGIIVAEIVGPVLSSWLMRKNLWVPVLVGIGCMLTAFISIIPLPETLQYRPIKLAVLAGEPTPEDEENPSDVAGKSENGWMVRQYETLKNALRFIVQDRTIAIVILLFFFNSLGSNAMALLTQYTSSRYKWSIADAILLKTLRSVVHLALFIFVLPAMPTTISKIYELTLQQANLKLAKISSVLLTVGMLIISVSPSVIPMILGLVVFNIGSGYGAAMRTVATSLVGGGESHDLAKLYTTISIMGALGNMLSGPLFPIAWAWGFDLGGILLGLPFILCAVMYLVMAGGTFSLHIRSKPSNEDEVESENNQ